jgi:alpha-beta hydrolase superfamily lysophospholipase
LFGWLHSPRSGHARGGVVLSPTLGIEAVSARYAYRCLADHLADAGFVALRFDYDGTGDSAGEDEEAGRVEAWLRSVRSATELVQGIGLGRVGVVGMRMGATLVAEVFGSGSASIDDLVLWDPCASGRNFLREQGALWNFALGGEAAGDGSIETPGLVYDANTVADLSALVIANGDGPMADRVLVLKRSGRTGDRRMNERLAMPHAEHRDIEGQAELVDAQPDTAKVPEATVATIVDWLVAGADGDPTVPIDLHAVGRAYATLVVEPDGTTIEERAVSLGPIGLFGIVATRGGPEVADRRGEATLATTAGAPTFFFFNAGVIDHVGPARLWVRLSRQWAQRGLRSVRCDISGLGESPVHPGQARQEVFPSEGLDDVSDALRAMLPDDPSNAVLLGLCSGAYYAVDAAVEHNVRGVCAVNPILTFNAPVTDPDEASASAAGTLEGRREVQGGMKSWVRAIPAYDRINRVVQHLPGAAWWIINRIAVKTSPARRLAQVVDAGVNVLVIAGTDEARWLRGGEGATLRKLEATGRFHMEVIPDLEHTLFERRTREVAVGVLTDHVIRSFGSSAPEV